MLRSQPTDPKAESLVRQTIYLIGNRYGPKSVNCNLAVWQKQKNNSYVLSVCLSVRLLVCVWIHACVCFLSVWVALATEDSKWCIASLKWKTDKYIKEKNLDIIWFCITFALVVCNCNNVWCLFVHYSVEFISYYLDRTNRLAEMKDRLDHLLTENSQLVEEETHLRIKWDNPSSLSLFY